MTILVHQRYEKRNLSYHLSGVTGRDANRKSERLRLRLRLWRSIPAPTPVPGILFRRHRLRAAPSYRSFYLIYLHLFRPRRRAVFDGSCPSSCFESNFSAAPARFRAKFPGTAGSCTGRDVEPERESSATASDIFLLSHQRPGRFDGNRNWSRRKQDGSRNEKSCNKLNSSIGRLNLKYRVAETTPEPPDSLHFARSWRRRDILPGARVEVGAEYFSKRRSRRVTW